MSDSDVYKMLYQETKYKYTNHLYGGGVAQKMKNLLGDTANTINKKKLQIESNLINIKKAKIDKKQAKIAQEAKDIEEKQNKLMYKKQNDKAKKKTMKEIQTVYETKLAKLKSTKKELKIFYKTFTKTKLNDLDPTMDLTSVYTKIKEDFKTEINNKIYAILIQETS